MKSLIQILSEISKSKFAKDEVKIEEDLTKFWLVYIWKNSWETVSRHRFKKDAEEIKQMILKGKTPADVQMKIDNQNKISFSKWISPHWVNW